MAASKARCAVTGASGFLGARLVELLAAEGAEVRAVVRPSSRLAAPAAAEIIRVPFADAEALTAALRGASLLFNCVGHSSDWGAWALFQDGNIDTVGQLFRAAARAGVRRIVHISTTDVYGYPRAACDERHPLVDVGLPYNRSKILGEELARRCAGELGLELTVLRPATIFGPRSHDWVVELSRELRARRVPTLSGGRTHAGLVYVDDVALAMMSLAGKGGGGDAYNVVDPEPISWRDYFAVLCAAMDIAPPRLDIPAGVAMGVARCSEALWRALRRETRPLFTRHVACVMSRDQHYSSDKLRRAVPEFPRIGLRRGLELTTAWLAAEPRSAR